MNLDELASSIELPEEFDGLPVFAVGGAVRDVLLGNEPHDIDLLVTEVSPDEMKKRGFREINSPNNHTFGVFMDSLGREVALPREEVDIVSEDVRTSEAIERDLKRRDFTINAMALDLRHKTLHDPHGGQGALDNKVLRHVSDAFRDDPLRILRGARFAARFDFQLAHETKVAMHESVDELVGLPAERSRLELEKVLVEADQPRIFFDVLSDVGALRNTFPEIFALQDVPAGPAEHHREGDAFEHTMRVLQEMKKLRPNDEIALLMALFHDVGKEATPVDELPHHHNHAENGVNVMDDAAKRLSLSNRQERACKEACSEHMKMHKLAEMNDTTVLKFWQNLHNSQRMIDLAIADELGREPQGAFPLVQAEKQHKLVKRVCAEIRGKDLIEQGYDPAEMGGEEFGDLLHQKRVELMRELE